MAKGPMDIDLGDVVYIENAKIFRKIVGLRQWFEYYNDTVGALANISNRKIDALDSGDAYMFYIESVEVLRDINLLLKYRNVEMQGSQGSGIITIHENGYGDPYMLNRFTYDQPWYADVTENLGLTLTNQNLALFKGIELEIVSLDEDELKKAKSGAFTLVPG
jgi:hypothetical protein